MTDQPTTKPTPKQVAINAATFLLHSYSMGPRDARPGVAMAIVKAVTVALITGEWKPDVRYDGVPVDHPLRYATTTPDGQAATGLATDDDTPEHLRHLYALAIKAQLAYGNLKATEPSDPKYHLRYVREAAALVDPLRAGLEEALSYAFAAHRGAATMGTLTEATQDWATLPPFDAAAWRDYTIHAQTVDDVAVLCRSDDVCEENIPNHDGRHLTLGEAADWAKRHVADHAKWAVEAAEALAEFDATQVREHPGAVQPMTAVAHPAGGTQTELSTSPAEWVEPIRAQVIPTEPTWCTSAIGTGHRCALVAGHPGLHGSGSQTWQTELSGERTCIAVYPTGPNPMPNTRIVRCGRPTGHDGDHEEFIDGEPSGCPWQDGAAA